jgi:hypothetical protein
MQLHAGAPALAALLECPAPGATLSGWTIAWQSMKPFLPHPYTLGPLSLLAAALAPAGIRTCLGRRLSFLTIMIHPRSGFLRNMIQGG